MATTVIQEVEFDSMLLYPCKEDCLRCIPCASKENLATGIIYYHVASVSLDVVKQIRYGLIAAC